jgi:parallel beta-helix repeat protein
MDRTTQKLGSILLIFLFFSTMTVLSSPAVDQKTYVSFPFYLMSAIHYVGGSGPGNYTRIQDAIDNSSNGDTIMVYHGFYRENIVIQPSLTIIGEDTKSTIIDGGESGTVVSISSDETHIEGFTIQNAGNDIHSAGIAISRAKNVRVAQCIIQDNGGLGITVSGKDTSLVTIDMNTIQNNSYGIYLYDSPQFSVRDNNICGNAEGMYIIGSPGSSIRDNTIVNRGLGLHIENSFDLLVQGNWIANNANGVYAFNSSEITFQDNTIRSNRWYGLWLKDASYSTIENNIISTNIDIGLFLESSYDTNVVNNTFWDNDNGIYLMDSSGNVFEQNNFRNDKLNACFVVHTLVHGRNLWRSNFWERARLLPYPILGIIKLQNISITWMNFDWSPLRHLVPFHHTARIGQNGCILYVGGNGPNNYSSIQTAIDDANSNDTVYVFNGTYYESILIDKPLRLIGENKTTTILEGNGTRDIITIIADYVTVSDFSIQNGHFNVLINHSSFGTIIDNNIDSGLHGLSVHDECHYLNISKNSFQENVYGIRLFSSSDITISNNILHSYKLNAFFFGTSFSHGRHRWYHNYWNQPRYLPNMVPGKIRLGDLSLTWFNIDWSPLKTPY